MDISELSPESLEWYQKLCISRERLRELVRLQMDWIGDCLRDGATSSLMPSLLITTKKHPNADEEHTLCMLAIDFNESWEKSGPLHRLGAKTYRARVFPVAVVLGSEAWEASEKQGAKHVEPRHNPNRQEIIMVAGQTLDRQHTAFAKMFILRRNGMIVPTRWEPIVEDVQFPLLRNFWAGFLAEIAGKLN